jgi:hypothetical protein
LGAEALRGNGMQFADHNARSVATVLRIDENARPESIFAQ